MFAEALALAQTKMATDVTFKAASFRGVHSFGRTTTPSEGDVNFLAGQRAGHCNGNTVHLSAQCWQRHGQLTWTWSADTYPQQQQQHRPTWSECHLSNILKMIKATKADKMKRQGSCQYFVPMSVCGVVCKAMVNNGNLWKNILYLDFLRRLGLTRADL
jgi:hypothetical protein